MEDPPPASNNARGGLFHQQYLGAPRGVHKGAGCANVDWCCVSVVLAILQRRGGVGEDDGGLVS